MGYYRPLFYNYNPILNGMGAIIAIFQFFAAIYLHVITDIGVLVDNSIFNVAPVADTHYW